MTHTFSWQTAGLNQARFQAYAALLRIKSGGQVNDRPEIVYELNADDDIGDYDDAKSDSAVTLSFSDETRLKAAFQDRIAELVSSNKGGQHVAATSMIESIESVTVVVARNGGLQEADENFLRKLQELLRAVAKNPTHDQKSRDLIWEVMLAYSSARLSIWMSDFQAAAQRYTACDNQGVENEDTQASSLYQHIRILLAICCQDFTSATVELAHTIWKKYDQQDFEELCGHRQEIARGLRLGVGFLGRLYIGFHVMMRTVERLDIFQQLTFVALPGPDAASSSESVKHGQERWTLVQTFQSLDLTLSNTTVKLLFGDKETVIGLNTKFERTQTHQLQTHAEVQLVIYAAQNPPVEGTYFGHIGCSKRSCFLCWEFLKSHGKFKTRACHGKLYTLWTLPEVNGLSQDQFHSLASALKSVEEAMGMQLKVEGKEVRHPAKESTVGGSSVETRAPTSRSWYAGSLVSQYLTSQRSTVRDPQSVIPDTSEYTEPAEAHHSVPQTPNIDRRTRSGPCYQCDTATGKRCPYCDRGWYCSLTCARKSIDHRFYCSGQTLTTADYLEKATLEDEIPDDPQTVEDYGFSRCNTNNDRSHLLGLYIGLLRLDNVSSHDLHIWRCKGTLVANIIASFETIPKRFRGGYFPWFLQNKQLLETIPSHTQQQPQDFFAAMLAKATPYLQPEDQDTYFMHLQPQEKSDAFLLLALVLQGAHPPPNMAGDLWYKFGFCTCADERDEHSLGGLYGKLLTGNMSRTAYNRSLGVPTLDIPDVPHASFEQFWTAYRDAQLGLLMEQHGLLEYQANRAQLGQFLATRPGDPHALIWRLMHYLAFEPAAVDVPTEAAEGAECYGFTDELNARTRLELRSLYKRLTRKANPLEIDEARTQGRLLELAQGLLQEIDADVAQVLGRLE